MKVNHNLADFGGEDGALQAGGDGVILTLKDERLIDEKTGLLRDADELGVLENVDLAVKDKDTYRKNLKNQKDYDPLAKLDKTLGMGV